jgi:hypothetical protein
VPPSSKNRGDFFAKWAAVHLKARPGFPFPSFTARSNRRRILSPRVGTAAQAEASQCGIASTYSSARAYRAQPKDPPQHYRPHQ